MEKQELLLNIINLIDENRELKNNLELLKNNRPVTSSVVSDVNDYEYALELKILNAFKPLILKECVYSWKEVSATRNDKGIINVTSYNSWLKEKISNIPDSISKNDFIEFFANELQEMYLKEKEEAIKSLQQREEEE